MKVATDKAMGGNPMAEIGTCYEDAWRFLIREKEGELVHGSVEREGKRIGHAWVELATGFIWEPQSRSFLKKDDFLTMLKPEEENRYNPTEAAIMAVRTKNLGPWSAKEREILRGEIPKTRVSSLGFIELELPVARAVEALVEERTISSGFHEKLNQRWTIVFDGVVTPKVAMAAQKAGLEVSYREAPIGTGHYFTDISLANVGREEIEKATTAFNRFTELYERNNPNPIGRGGAMEEIRARQIAEEAAVKAAELTGSKVIQQVAKELSGEVLHGSPISPHCEAVLAEPPICWDFRGIRSYVLCKAWAIMEEEKRTRLPVGEAWSEARRVCVRE